MNEAKVMKEATAQEHLLSVVIPAYNEEEGIAEIIERVLAVRPALEAIGIGLELIVVDDGSRDRTVEKVQAYPEVVLLQHSRNQGYGAALKTGFHHARGDLLGFLDADGTYPPEYFPQLCRAALAGADLVIGSRMSGEKSEMPLVRRIGNYIFANLVTLVSGRKVSDSASGMRVIRREALTKLYPLPDGLNFTPVMSTRAMHEAIKVVEVPIPYRERQGRSKLSVVRDGVRFLTTIVWTALTYNPVRLLGGAGLALVAFAALVVGGLVITRLGGTTQLGSWGVLGVFAGGVAAVLGVMLFALGATFNHLVSLFEQRPVRRGLFGKPLFSTPLEEQFWWMGLLVLGGGMLLGLFDLWAALHAWAMSRLWLYLLGSAMAILLGTELIVFWIIIAVLETLHHRDAAIISDMEGGECLT